MGNFFTDNDDLRFYFERGIDWPALASLAEYGFRSKGGFSSVDEAVEFYREIAGSMGALAADVVAPRAARLDREDSVIVDGEVVEAPAVREICDALKQADVHRMCIPRELDGLSVPLIVYYVGGEMIARGDASMMTHYSFHAGIAMALLAYSINEGSTEFDTNNVGIASSRFEREIKDMASGAAWGCMDITEPDAGSDMARLRCRGEQDEEGNWFITGQKIFISSGHAKYHLVIARTEAAAGDGAGDGLDGLSMFLVQAYEDLPDGKRHRTVTIERVEEKLGHHGSVTAALSFERTPAQLIGRRGEGFKYMLVMMNGARVGVGFESIGVIECAVRMARAYAEERKSMGKAIARHEMIADYLDEMETDALGLRALAVASAVHEESAQKLQLFARFTQLHTDEEKTRVAKELPRHKVRARRFTPLLKYLAAEKSVEAARRAVQIHGGVGYTKEYGAEKLLRDAMVLPIYEGTSQIQSLMAMKDALGAIVKDPGGFVRSMADAQWRARTAADPLERRVAKIQVLSHGARQFLMTRTAAHKMRSLSGIPVKGWRRALTKEWDPKRDFSLAMLHAERLTKILADEAIAELLWEQARVHADRRVVLERWLDRCEVRDRALYEEILRGDPRGLTGRKHEDESAGASVSDAAE